MMKAYKIILLSMLMAMMGLQAEEKSGAAKTETTTQTPVEKTVEAAGSVKVNGAQIKYKTISGNFLLKDNNDNAKASFFYVAYIRDDVKDYNQRPVTFCFNGGPGSSSIWLHMGAFGPKIVQFPDLGYPQAPYRLEDNQSTLLDITDLVFIDPVSTGYSYAVSPQDPKHYHGIEEDIKSVGEFIRMWLTQYNRWESPKFIAGESYGTTRAAGLSYYLHDNLYIYLNGVILVSTILDFQAYNFDTANDLPYLTYLPSYTSTAWYHKKLPADLQSDLTQAIREAEKFAATDYALALFQGSNLSPEAKDQVAEKVAKFTGLSKKYVLDSDLRIPQSRFAKELFADENEVVGRFDSRYKSYDTDGVGSYCGLDPSLEPLMGAYTGAFNYYLRNDLGWNSPKEYKVIAEVWPWDYGSAKNEYVHMSEELRKNMIKNPKLKIFVASGIYDLATPFSGANYSFSHLNLDRSLQKNISVNYYEAGHMMYLHKPSLVKLKNDLAQFYKNTMSGDRQ